MITNFHPRVSFSAGGDRSEPDLVIRLLMGYLSVAVVALDAINYPVMGEMLESVPDASGNPTRQQDSAAEVPTEHGAVCRASRLERIR